MAYYNQYSYKSVPYPSRSKPGATVSSSGCGVCCMSMVVEGLTGQTVTPAQMAPFAISAGARVDGGTDMHRLGAAAARRWDLTMTTTSDVGELLAAIRRGGMAIANVGGDHGSYKGLFSNGGHYVAVVGMHREQLVVWDPGQYDGKYSTSARVGRLQAVGHDLRVLPSILDADCSTRSPRYYIFERRDHVTQADFDRMMDDWLARRAQEPPSGWAVPELTRAVELGITDGTRPQSYATRQEVAVMLTRAIDREDPNE